MSVLRVLTYPHATLRAACAPLALPLAPPPSPLHALCADLLATVRAQRGLGLAAPQVGHALRLFAMRVPAARTEAEARRLSAPARRALAAAQPAFVVAAHPRIVLPPPPPPPGGDARGGGVGGESAAAAAAEAPSRLGWEACLSLPGGGSLVRRKARVTVEYALVAASDARLLERERALRRLAAREQREQRAASAAAKGLGAVAGAVAGGDGGGDGDSDGDGGGDDAAPLIVRETLEGLPAVVFQHELDHLDGVLITDREERHFRASTLERETEEAHMRFAQGLTRFYADESAFDG